jgi:chromosome partitioning protein
MSSPEPDILRRGQAIFDRLRGGSNEPPPESPAAEVVEAEEIETSEAAAEPAPEPAPEPPVALAEEPEEPPAPVPNPPTMAEIVGEAATNMAATPVVETASEATPSEAAPVRKAHPASLRPLPRVIAVANQKGGVGKTTTAVNLGAGLAELGFRVLIVDLDPQGNATTGLGINQRNLEHSVYDVLLHDVALDDCVEPTAVRNLFVAPATIDLAGADIELVPAFSRELRLRRAIEALDDSFDFTIIDCPPSLGLITVNGLAAATEVLVPIQCEYYALEGLGQLLKNVNLVTGNLNPTLEVSAIVLTMYDSRTKLAEQVADEVRTHFGDRVCRMVIPRTVRLSEAPSFGQPILTFDPTSRGAVAYRELAKEVSGGAP